MGASLTRWSRRPLVLHPMRQVDRARLQTLTSGTWSARPMRLASAVSTRGRQEHLRARAGPTAMTNSVKLREPYRRPPQTLPRVPARVTAQTQAMLRVKLLGQVGIVEAGT